MGALQVLVFKNIFRNAKLRICKTYISELWKLNIKEPNALDICEGKFLKEIYGGKKI